MAGGRETGRGFGVVRCVVVGELICDFYSYSTVSCRVKILSRNFLRVQNIRPTMNGQKNLCAFNNIIRSLSLSLSLLLRNVGRCFAYNRRRQPPPPGRPFHCSRPCSVAVKIAHTCQQLRNHFRYRFPLAAFQTSDPPTYGPRPLLHAAVLP